MSNLKTTTQNNKSNTQDKALNPKRYTLNAKKGFTLIEAIVSIGVLTIGLTGVLSLANQSLTIASASKTRLIASNLAQEGIEIVRNIRDNNWLAEQPFNQGMSDGDYQVDEPGSVSLSPYQNQVLYFDPTTNLYNNLGVGSPSAFKRKITITTISATEIKIVGRIEWTDRNRNLSLEIEERLLNWK